MRTYENQKQNDDQAYHVWKYAWIEYAQHQPRKGTIVVCWQVKDFFYEQATTTSRLRYQENNPEPKQNANYVKTKVWQ